MTQPHIRRFDFRRGFAAMRALAANPDDLPQVFTIIESLSGNTITRVAARYAETEGGRRLLSERPDITKVLTDRAALARLPEGSLGRAYLDFMERENLSAEGIQTADAEGANESHLPPPFDYVHKRMRDTHDLWHAVTGYQGDVLGEVALLAFTFAQTRNPAIALIIVVGLLKTIGEPEAQRVIFDGFRRGRKAAWLPPQEWEKLLALPVDEVRARLSLEAPPQYVPVRSSELRARRAAA